jgi:hypothetical protein
MRLTNKKAIVGTIVFTMVGLGALGLVQGVNRVRDSADKAN